MRPENPDEWRRVLATAATSTSRPHLSCQQSSRPATTLFSHPAVEAVTYWGFADGQMWLGAPGGFLREDGSKKPAYDALQSLVRDQWWTPPQTLRTDDTGRLHLDGFAGRYSVAAASGAVEVELGPGNAVAEAQLVVE